MLSYFRITKWLLVLLIFQNCISIDRNVLIEHVKKSISNGEKGISNLTPEILNIEGASSAKVRHFLNNLCNFPEVHYLEIGLWKGSTFTSALYNNNHIKAIGIDNWSHEARPRDDFFKNINHIKHKNFNIIENDSFSVDVSSLKDKFNIYFYDGDHSKESQKLAFTHYNQVLDEVFVAIVDDWNWYEVRQGTREAFSELNYKILFDIELPAALIGDPNQWWNGLYVAVISKK